MENLLHSELNMVLYTNSINIDYARNKFKMVFNSDPGNTFFGNLLLSKGPATQHIKKDNVNIFIHGEIYEGMNIIESFYTINKQKDKVNEALSKINGSFTILIIDERSEEVYIITDRINTKRIYFYKKDSFIILTTNPDYFKNIDSEVNIGGIASYLINGVVYNDNTLYKNIRALDKASLHKIVNGEHTKAPYWKYIFTNEYDGISKDELKKKFAEVLIQSVSRRITACKPNTCFVSLSGGYDSRFLIGAIRALNSGYKIKTFSYGMEEKRLLGDDSIASQLAKKFGFEHHFEPAYVNDLLRTISLNVKYGHGYSNFCDEVDAWLNLSKLFSKDPSSLLFVGDMFYHSSFDFTYVKDKRLPLNTVVVYPWYYIKPFLTILPAESKERLISGYDEMYQNIIQKLPDTNDFKVLKDFAYLDQRISHTLIYWREFFHRPFIKVTQPLLDNDVLDFYRKLPQVLRYKKSLYKETLHDMFPDLFEVPIAKNIWVYPSWLKEVEKNKAELFSRITHNSSSLDSIIPPQTILSLIGNDEKKNIRFGTGNTIRAVKKLSSRNDTFNNLLGGIVLRNTHITKTQLMIRLLLLREALEF